MREDHPKHPRCATCRYRADTNSWHNCDYLWLTGKSRSGQIAKKKDMAPERCPLYEEGARIDNKHEEQWWQEVQREYGSKTY